MTSDITVIIPTYNRAKDLARTLKGMVRAEKGNLSTENKKRLANCLQGITNLGYQIETVRLGKKSRRGTQL